MKQDVAIDVLVVDDEPVVREFIRNALEHTGLTVHTAEGFKDGLRRLKRARYRVLLADQNMPDGTGLELVHRVSTDPSIRPILITGYPSAQILEEAAFAGAREVWDKPFDDLDAFIARVQEAIAAANLSAEQQAG